MRFFSEEKKHTSLEAQSSVLGIEDLKPILCSYSEAAAIVKKDINFIAQISLKTSNFYQNLTVQLLGQSNCNKQDQNPKPKTRGR